MTYILRIQWVSFLNRLVPFYFCIPFYVTGPSIKTLVSMACLYIVSIKLAPAGGGSSLGVSVSPQSAPTSLSRRETGEAPGSHRNLLMLLPLPSPHNDSFLVWEITVLWIRWELWESRSLGLSLPSGVQTAACGEPVEALLCWVAIEHELSRDARWSGKVSRPVCCHSCLDVHLLVSFGGL